MFTWCNCDKNIAAGIAMSEFCTNSLGLRLRCKNNRHGSAPCEQGLTFAVYTCLTSLTRAKLNDKMAFPA